MFYDSSWRGGLDHLRRLSLMIPGASGPGGVPRAIGISNRRTTEKNAYLFAG